MKSTRQKGNEFQDFCAAWLRDQGYDVYNQKTVAKRIKAGVWISLRQDIFGMDILAIKTGEKPLFLQATAHTNVQKRLDEILRHPWPLQFVTVQVWQKKDNKQINIKQLDGQKLVDYAKIIRRKLFLLTEATP
ncbi:hypothetical protein ES703_71688 [subsurface metagenome]